MKVSNNRNFLEKSRFFFVFMLDLRLKYHKKGEKITIFFIPVIKWTAFSLFIYYYIVIFDYIIFFQTFPVYFYNGPKIIHCKM